MRRTNQGITLIALIVTIIVMLILVAVTVSVIVESDLIGTAEKTADKYKSEYEKEQGLGQITVGNKTYASINEYLNDNPISGGDDPDGGDEVEDLQPGERAPEGNGTFKGIPIPEGFTVSKIPGEYGDTEEGVNGGVVIYDIPSTVDTSAETFWTAETTVGTQTYPTVQVSYNQFVWVPVAEAYITAAEITNMINSTEEKYASVTSNQTAINYLISQGRYPMAVQIPTKDAQGNDTVMYRGILYNFAKGTDGAVTITSKADFSILASESYDNAVANAKTYYREPGMVSYDYTTQNGTLQYNTIGLTQASLQEEYNNMVKSVADNGGFYVARYELTYETDNSGNAIYGTRRGKTVANASTFTSSGGLNMWYGLYNKCQNLYNNENLPVQSAMISGAQYDQIMIWMKGVTNTYTKSDGTTVNTYYVVDSTNMGNYNVASGGTGSRKVSGYLNNYSVKKVFDLGGNLYDWTTEANDTNSRVMRGNIYYDSGSDYPASDPSNRNPNNANSADSARFALCVK